MIASRETTAVLMLAEIGTALGEAIREVGGIEADTARRLADTFGARLAARLEAVGLLGGAGG